MFLKDCLGFCEEAPAGSWPVRVEHAQMGAESPDKDQSDVLRRLKVEPTQCPAGVTVELEGKRSSRCEARFSILNK